MAKIEKPINIYINIMAKFVVVSLYIKIDISIDNVKHFCGFVTRTTLSS